MRLYRLFILAVFLLIQCEKEEPEPEPESKYEIKDINFLNVLIERGVDINGDSIISPEEAKTITDLDVSDKTDLVGLYCSFSQLISLDISGNVALKYLHCGNNQLTSLDILNNTSLGLALGNMYLYCYLEIGNMPSLDEVCVWRLPFPSEGFLLCMDGTPNVYFTTKCSK
jgi:hypothetical protein